MTHAVDMSFWFGMLCGVLLCLAASAFLERKGGKE